MPTDPVESARLAIDHYVTRLSIGYRQLAEACDMNADRLIEFMNSDISDLTQNEVDKLTSVLGDLSAAEAQENADIEEYNKAHPGREADYPITLLDVHRMNQ